MKHPLNCLSPRSFPVSIALVAGLTALSASGQDRLKTMPGYAHHERITHESTNAVKWGILSVTWKDEGKAFEYQRDGKRYRYDIGLGTTTAAKRLPRISISIFAPAFADSGGA